MKIYTFELRRAFKMPGFYLSLLVGIVIAVIDWITHSLKYALVLDDYMKHVVHMVYPASAYEWWIGCNASRYASLFFLILPLLAVMPFATSFYTDNKSHYINFICTRVNRRDYFKSKFYATFLSGGIVVVVPLILNFMLSAAVLPCILPQSAANVRLVDKSSLSMLYYQYPLVFTVLSLCIIFVFAGTLAVSALYIAFYSKWIFSVMLFPFIISLVIMSVADLLEKSVWEPINFLNPVCQEPRIIAFAIETIILLSVAIWEFIVSGKKQDVI